MFIWYSVKWFPSIVEEVLPSDAAAATPPPKRLFYFTDYTDPGISESPKIYENLTSPDTVLNRGWVLTEEC